MCKILIAWSSEGVESAKGDKTEKSEEEKKEDGKREEEQKKLAEARKPVVIDRTVFQAFAHFDQNLCGYFSRINLIWVTKTILHVFTLGLV